VEIKYAIVVDEIEGKVLGFCSDEPSKTSTKSLQVTKEKYNEVTKNPSEWRYKQGAFIFTPTPEPIEPTPEEKKEIKRQQCNAYYNPKFEGYKSAYLGALMDNIEGNEAPIMTDYQKLLEEYTAAIKAIEEGTDTVQTVPYNEYCPNCGTLLAENKCPNCGWRL